MWPFNRKKWEKRGVSVSPEILRFELATMRGVKAVPPMRDTNYRAISYKDFMVLVEKYRRTDDGPYVVNIRDCDKYAIFFQADIMRGWADCSNGQEALAFGYMSGLVKTDTGKTICHGWIWQRDDDGKYWYLHGQTAAPMSWEIINFNLATG